MHREVHHNYYRPGLNHPGLIHQGWHDQRFMELVCIVQIPDAYFQKILKGAEKNVGRFLFKFPAL